MKQGLLLLLLSAFSSHLYAHPMDEGITIFQYLRINLKPECIQVDFRVTFNEYISQFMLYRFDLDKNETLDKEEMNALLLDGRDTLKAIFKIRAADLSQYLPGVHPMSASQLVHLDENLDRKVDQIEYFHWLKANRKEQITLFNQDPKGMVFNLPPFLENSTDKSSAKFITIDDYTFLQATYLLTIPWPKTSGCGNLFTMQFLTEVNRNTTGSVMRLGQATEGVIVIDHTFQKDNQSDDPEKLDFIKQKIADVPKNTSVLLLVELKKEIQPDIPSSP